MKNTIRLTEKDLTDLIKKVLIAEEDVRYKLKVPVESEPSAPMPDMGASPVEDSEMPPVDLGGDQVDATEAEGEESPFGKEKFDAGIEVDEDEDPKKYIEKLTGKLAQKLRDYNSSESDVDLNKFVINSLIPAAIPQMDEDDAKDVIKKVKENMGKGSTQGGEEAVDAEPGGEDIATNEPDQEVEPESNNEDGLPPVDATKKESVDKEIEELISEIMRGKSVKRNSQHKNPFKSPKFK